MMPINAVWIDSEKEFIVSMQSLLDGMTDDHCFIRHLPTWDALSTSSLPWSEIDVVLGDIDLDIVPEIRKLKADVPIVMVSNRTDKTNLLRAINLGINGFIEKPVNLAALRETLERFRAKDCGLKMNEDRKAIHSQGKWVDLTSTEYKIIDTLRTAGRRLTRTELQAAVWPNSSISENNLDTHLTNLKRKIPELAACLNVKRGLGYYLDTKSQ